MKILNDKLRNALRRIFRILRLIFGVDTGNYKYVEVPTEPLNTAADDTDSKQTEHMMDLSQPLPNEQHELPQPGQPAAGGIWVPENRIGSIIGFQGSVIKSLQDRSGAFMSVDNFTVRGNCKLLRIVGGTDECNIARQIVAELIQPPPSWPAAARAAPTPLFQPPSTGPPGEVDSYGLAQRKDGQRPSELHLVRESSQNAASPMAHPHLPTMLQMWVPQDLVDAVIGIEGEVLMSLRRKSQAVIRVHDETVRDHRKLFTISGRPNECYVACQLVAEIIERQNSGDAEHAAAAEYSQPSSPEPCRERPGSASHEPTTEKLTKTLKVPEGAVAQIIGRQGQNIRHLEEKTDARIFVTPAWDTTQDAIEREVKISGTERAVSDAHQLVLNIVEKAKARQPATADVPAGGGAPEGLRPYDY